MKFYSVICLVFLVFFSTINNAHREGQSHITMSQERMQGEIDAFITRRKLVIDEDDVKLFDRTKKGRENRLANLRKNADAASESMGSEQKYCFLQTVSEAYSAPNPIYYLLEKNKEICETQLDLCSYIRETVFDQTPYWAGIQALGKLLEREDLKCRIIIHLPINAVVADLKYLQFLFDHLSNELNYDELTQVWLIKGTEVGLPMQEAWWSLRSSDFADGIPLEFLSTWDEELLPLNVDEFSTVVKPNHPVCVGAILVFTEETISQMPNYLGTDCKEIRKIPTIFDVTLSQDKKYIFQTGKYLPDELPWNLYNTAYKWAQMNPDYTYVYFDDEGVDLFMSEVMGDRIFKAYKRIIPGAYRADFFRYCLMAKFKGIYVDIDIVPHKPIDDFISNFGHVDFLTYVDELGLWQGFLYNNNVVNTTLMQNCIDLIVYNAENFIYSCHILDVTGPVLIGRVISNYYGGITWTSDLFFPGDYWYLKRNGYVTVITCCPKVDITGFPGDGWFRRALTNPHPEPSRRELMHYSDMWRQFKIYNDQPDDVLEKQISVERDYCLWENKKKMLAEEKHGLDWGDKKRSDFTFTIPLDGPSQTRRMLDEDTEN